MGWGGYGDGSLGGVRYRTPYGTKEISRVQEGNLASEQQDASVGHDSGLTHAPDVLRLRIVPPLGLAYM